MNSTDRRVSGPVVVAAVHLPPPVHGESLASAQFVDMLREACNGHQARLIVRRISAKPGVSRLRHHLERLVRVLRATATVMRHRPSALYVSADGGMGIAYSMMLSGTARLLGLPAYVHHHSGVSFGDRPRLRMRALIRVAGSTARHIVGCEEALDRYQVLYGRENGDVLLLKWAVDTTEFERTAGRVGRDRSGRLRLGHLSNLSRAKGLELIFRTAEAVAERRKDVELVLAGPTAEPEDERLLESLLESSPIPSFHVGPVYGDDRSAFLASLDVFLMPSRYAHEFFALVVCEAICCGVPVIVFETPCMTARQIGANGLVVRREQDYVAAATEWIACLEGPRSDALGPDARTAEFVRTCREAREVAREYAERIVTGNQV